MNRINYLDIAKGLLILCLMLSHFGSAIRRLEVYNEWFNMIYSVTPLFTCFFMQCFFLISGYCSSFKGSLRTFCSKQFKQIIIPWFFFEVIGQLLTALFWGNFNGMYNLLLPPNTTLWFFSALLFSKIFCYVIINYIKSNRILIGSSLSLLLLALIINQYNLIPNILAFQNALAACFFVSLGYVMRLRGFSDKIMNISFIVYILSILVLRVLRLTFPVLDAGVSNVGWQYFPIILIVAISGSFACLFICKKINRFRFLEYFGRNSIIVYGLHFIPLLCCIKFYTNLIMPNGIMSMLLIAFLIYASLFVILVILIKIFNTKYLKWIIGR